MKGSRESSKKGGRTASPEMPVPHRKYWETGFLEVPLCSGAEFLNVGSTAGPWQNREGSPGRRAAAGVTADWPAGL